MTKHQIQLSDLKHESSSVVDSNETARVIVVAPTEASELEQEYKVLEMITQLLMVDTVIVSITRHVRDKSTSVFNATPFSVGLMINSHLYSLPPLGKYSS